MAKPKPRPIDEYFVFLASPGDVEQERKVVRKFFDDYNRNTGRHHGLRFTVLDWENYGEAGVGRPQDLITKQTLERYKESLALVIGLMAQRFGTPTGDHESGTEEEFEWAFAQNKKNGWPEIKWFFREIDKLEIPTDAKEARKALKQWEKVQAFREKVQKEGDRQLFCKSYTDVDKFGEVLRNDLERWLADPDRQRSHTRRDKQPPPSTKPGRKADDVPPDPSAYLQRLHGKSQYIDIRGLQTGTGKAHRFPIDELYIPLTTHGSAEQPGKRHRGKQVEELEPGRTESVDLRECLKHRCLVVLGDPGAGKTTFLRRVAFELCCKQLGEGNATAAAPWSALGDAFPIFVPLADLVRHQTVAREQRTGPHGDDVSDWLVHFAATRANETGVGLDEAFFRSILKDGRAIVLLDALDEVPSSEARLGMRTLIENAVEDYAKCRFIVTSRPAAFVGDVVLAGFEQARIAPLEEEAIEAFLERWCLALADHNEADAKEHLNELLIPLRKLPEVRRMARNPVMLTALAVVHWNEKRLPEQRAELYESIIGWLAKQRPHSEGRPKPEQCVALLQNLALAMQDHHKGRQTQVSRHWGARAIAPSFREVPEDERVSAAEAFLSEEEVDSGIIVGRGEHEIRFWHLTFQEYLAARGLAARMEKVQAETLLATDKLYAQEWREVVLLMAGVLHRQGFERVDGMFETILEKVGPKAPLEAKARCAGLLNAILGDLGPVGYKPDNERYAAIVRDAMAVFDAKRSKGITIKVAIEAAEAIAHGGDPRFSDQQSKQNWIEIPAGAFLMGAQNKDKAALNHDAQADHDESPVHEVHLEAYRIGKYPVTVGEYERFVGAGGYANEAHWKAGGFGDNEQPDNWEEQLTHLNRPVTQVSWYEATAYAHWAECRLATEAEWERAARGVEGRRFPWGKPDPDDFLANYASNIGNPTPVGVYPQGGTPEGIQDMAGNVWEWCQDMWYESYKGAPTDGSAWTTGGERSARVLRGGSWSHVGQLLRSACRGWGTPGTRGDYIGFRVSAGT